MALPRNTTENKPAENYDYSTSGQAQFLQTENYNPFAESVTEKQYHKTNIDPNQIPQVIEEFQLITPITSAENINQNGNEEVTNTNQPSEPTEQASFNPAVNELTSKDKRTAATMAAETAMDAYALIWKQFLTPIAQFDVKKINNQIEEGNISSSLTIPIDEHQEVPIREFVKGFNESVAEALAVTDDFRNEIREPLIKIMEKNGIGMTDEQKVGYEILKDAGIKTSIIFSIKSDIKKISNNFIERTKQMSNPTADKTVQFSESNDNSTAPIIATNPEIIPIPTTKEEVAQVKKVTKVKTSRPPNQIKSFVVKEQLPIAGGNLDVLNDMENMAKSGKTIKRSPMKNPTTVIKTSTTNPSKK